ncbi:hypothetical protein DPMN_098187 [Dreissena polymorpha]|uniref:Uncharacterized protein n=1 Tax=Dreissena polymorpha TaxID=45954 RepID=A0A9D4R6F3_DREPO|nr:hypothetical protein DPMN_098187 [Dreissena polymorpha]
MFIGGYETLLAGVPLLPPQPFLHLIRMRAEKVGGAYLEPLCLIISCRWSPQEYHLQSTFSESEQSF